MTVTVGADPEFFYYGPDGSGYNNILPCIGKVPGTKSNPHQLGDGYFTHEDNVCVELGVPPTPRGWDLGDIVTEGQHRIKHEFFDGNSFALYIHPVFIFSPNQLDNKQAQTFGCEPDFNAYENGKVRTVPRNLLKGNDRFAGGHIHIGGDFNCPPFVAALFADIFLSIVPIASGYRSFTNSDLGRRINHYGQPGTFRPKDYGIEYRTPSNWWCADSEKGNHVGNLAFSLGTYLENTGATTLRETVQKINWLAIRSLIQSTPGKTQDAVREAAQGLLDECRAVGVPLA